MSKKKSDQARMTIYRLVGLDKLHQAIRDGYNDFKQFEFTIGEYEALLVSGSTPAHDVRWKDTVESISRKSVNLKSSAAAAVILIKNKPNATASDNTTEVPIEIQETQTPDEKINEENGEAASENKLEAWAVTFGFGFQLLDQSYIDVGFGKRIAIRCIDPDSLKSITKVTLDDRAKTDRSSIPSGVSLRGFGFEEIGELATRLVASGKIDNIWGADKSATVRGADALSVPLSKKPQELIKNLQHLKTLLDKAPVTDELASLENITLIPSKNKQLMEQLDEKLLEAIETPTDNRLSLAWPHEAVEEIGEVQAFRLYRAQRKGKTDGLPTLDALLEPLRDKSLDEAQKARRFKNMSVLLENVDGDAKKELPVKNWLTFEVDLNGVKNFLYGGRWYSVKYDYAGQIKKKTEDIFKRHNPISNLPAWTENYVNESEYNHELAKTCGGLCLDAKLISVAPQKQGIEACDVLLKDGIFIHVKRVESSAPASHLLAQALVSADILSYDTDAQTKLKELICKAGGNPDEYSVKPRQVVIIMAKTGKALTADSLYTFTQVNLNRQDKMLASRGVEVVVVPIERETPSGDEAAVAADDGVSEHGTNI